MVGNIIRLLDGWLMKRGCIDGWMVGDMVGWMVDETSLGRWMDDW